MTTQANVFFQQPPTSPVTRRSSYRGAVLALGLGAEAQRAFAEAADQAALIPSLEASFDEADGWLEEHHPLAIVVEGDARRVEAACAALRERPLLANVPVLAIVPRVDDLAFEALFGAGGDDLVPRGDAGALGRRLRALALTGDVPHSRRRGLAVVAHAEARAR
ncbi:MAG TPA: hypothetical protein VHB21_22430, partial [Minicystis sp.]|nr:hypothetical protein [Minicystis sp.]